MLMQLYEARVYGQPYMVGTPEQVAEALGVDESYARYAIGGKDGMKKLRLDPVEWDGEAPCFLEPRPLYCELAEALPSERTRDVSMLALVLIENGVRSMDEFMSTPLAEMDGFKGFGPRALKLARKLKPDNVYAVGDVVRLVGLLDGKTHGWLSVVKATEEREGRPCVLVDSEWGETKERWVPEDAVLSKVEWKRCPLCGGEAVLSTGMNHWPGDDSCWAELSCSCGLSFAVREMPMLEDALKAVYDGWNGRRR